MSVLQEQWRTAVSLRTLPPRDRNSLQNEIVVVDGTRPFYWDPVNTETDNGDSVLAIDGNPGRWRALSTNGPIDVVTASAAVESLSVDLRKGPASIYQAQFILSYGQSSAQDWSLRPNLQNYATMSRLRREHVRGGASVAVSDAANSIIASADGTVYTTLVVDLTIFKQGTFKRLMKGTAHAFEFALGLAGKSYDFDVWWNETAITWETLAIFSNSAALGVGAGSIARLWAVTD